MHGNMEIMRWRCTLALACLGTASAQNLSLGIAAGGAPTDAFESITTPGHSFYSQSADYLIGATFEYHLPRNFSVETASYFASSISPASWGPPSCPHP
jgi:hypothetical protein